MPDARLGELDRVSGRIAKIDGPAAALPLELGFDGDAFLDQAAAPCADLSRARRKTKVPRTNGAVRRRRSLPTRNLGRGDIRVEDQEHLLAAAEERLPSLALGNAVEADHLGIETPR